MKNSKKYIDSLMHCLILLLLSGLVLGGCQTTSPNTSTQTSSCDTVTGIEGEYTCTGECVITEGGTRVLVQVTGETDSVKRFPGSSGSLYQVKIVGGNGFKELEIGVLNGRTLRTATAEVSDSLFPVIEEYVFETDSSCKVVGFTKIVRNPNARSFKACVIHGKKNTH
jgi:hypothetical protein